MSSRAVSSRAADDDVVIVDANVLLYAVDSAAAHHERSHSWLEA